MKKINGEALIEVLRDKAPRALHVAEVCSYAEIDKRRMGDVQNVLDELVAAGDLTEMPGGRYRRKPKRTRRAAAAPPAAERLPKRVRRTGKIVQRRSRRSGWDHPEWDRPRTSFDGGVPERGYLQRNPRGFGFVAPESGTEDIFVPAEYLGAALHGDFVEVVARPSRKGREGRVIAVLERRTPRFSATLHRSGKNAWLEPDDPRLPERIEVFDLRDDVSGLAVTAQFVRYPQEADDMPAAEIVEVLGVQGMTDVEISKIKIREGIMEEFDAATLAEVATLPKKVPEKDIEGREDLRHLDLTTIDPADARDHDDALFAERLTKGYRLTVAIADVSHYVREGTAVDRSAIARMTSIYLPNRAIPMLPPEISSGLASLVPDEDRLCMAVEVDVGPSGAIRSSRLIEGVMRSRARITYEGAAAALGLTDDVPHEPEADKRQEGLQVLYDLSKVLRKRRMRRGALDFDLPEPKIILDAHNVEPIDVRQSRKDEGIREAYRIVEEMMLLANEVVARELKRRGVPAIHRIHGKPDDMKIEKFAKLARALGYEVTVESAKDPKQLSKFLRSIEGTEQADVLRYLLLRSMQQAAYDIDETVGHFGLAAADYLHFTSPIRRYPDLVVHRILKMVLRNRPIDVATMVPRLRSFSANASRLERRAITVERDVIDLYRVILMKDRVEEEFDATITSVGDYGLFVRFDSPFVEAMVPVESLGNDYFELGDLGIRLIGSRTGKIFSLGDKIHVRLEEANLHRRRLTAVPSDHAPITKRIGEDETAEELSRRHDKRGKRGRRDDDKGGKRRKSRHAKEGRKEHGKSDGKTKGKKKSKSRDGKRGKKTRS